MTSPEMAFAQWRDSLPVVVVDGERFFVIHDDRLVDEEQLRTEWTGIEGGTHGKPGSEDVGAPEYPDEA